MSAKILDLDPAQRLRRQTAEVMQKCSVDQIMDLLRDWEKIHHRQGYIDGEQAASDRFDRLFLGSEPTPPTPPSAA
jgi:hypothetical protein